MMEPGGLFGLEREEGETGAAGGAHRRDWKAFYSSTLLLGIDTASQVIEWTQQASEGANTNTLALIEERCKPYYHCRNPMASGIPMNGERSTLMGAPEWRTPRV